MGGFELVIATEEERMLVCDNLVKPRRKICGNILKIKITLVEDNPTQALVIQEFDTAETVELVGNGRYTIYVCNGGCLTRRQRQYTHRYIHTYGPVRTNSFKFVTCKRCGKRYSWRKFKKICL
jgi:hypothetical protein